MHLRIYSATLFRFDLYGESLDVTLSSIADRWTYIVVSLDNGYVQRVYQDGAYINSRTAGGYFIGNDSWNIGRWVLTGGEPFSGLIDEIRISSTVRSADWITTEYRNQNNPAGYETVGAEEGTSADAFFLLFD